MSSPKWSYDELARIGLDLDPQNHSFTYTYPPAKYALNNGKVRHDLSAVHGCHGWKDVSLYLHIPFCAMDCRFCSLHRIPNASTNLIDAYLHVLESEIKLWAARVERARVTSVYVGGGTPTLLQAKQLVRLLELIERNYGLAEDVEVTVECAPDMSRTYQEWDEYCEEIGSAALPVTRMSLGVQSWRDPTLRNMGRRGGRSTVLTALEAINNHYVSYNIDFILGYPNESQGITGEVGAIFQAINELSTIGMRLPSISVYQLWDAQTVRVARSRQATYASSEELLNAKWQLQHFLYTAGYMPSPGASFILSTVEPHRWTLHRCKSFRHIGMGSGAYSFYPNGFGQRRRDIHAYVKTQSEPLALDAQTITYVLSDDEQEIRRIILGLKSFDSIDLPRNKNWNALGELHEKIDRLCGLGLLVQADRTMRVSPEAFVLSEEIAAFLHPSKMPRRS